MSIRAYRVTKFESDREFTFNCWHDTAFMEFLERSGEVYDSRNANGNGLIEVPIDVLQRAIDTAELNLEPDVSKALQADISCAKSNGRESVIYTCG